PCVIVDKAGHILVWYLPQLLSDSQQKKLIDATEHLNPILKGTVNGKTWRTDPTAFVDDGTQTMQAGTQTFSPGWFGIGHGTSLSIRKNIKHGVGEWMDDTMGVEEYLNLVTSITHPELYQAGKQALGKLQQMKDTQEFAEKWTSIYSGLSVITNRETEEHRDRHGSYEWYDQLVSVGSYEAASFELPELGAKLDYKPGTVIQLCGNLLQHKVQAWGSGDRVCYAHFIRKDVFNHLHVLYPDW
ncbi:hypothetical protein P691DRAFT_648776, partial [Macrolepiota fuliginosa MF-IS2]